MEIRSLRIPQDIDQAIEYVSKMEKTEKTQSLRKLARLGFEYYVSKSYAEGIITLREASKLLGLTVSAQG
jgi:predicted HTH domain antitoxin